MIQPLNTTQLSSAKPRGGLQSISDLLPKLLKQYELQAEARRQMEEDDLIRKSRRSKRAKQATFSWYK